MKYFPLTLFLVFICSSIFVQAQTPDKELIENSVSQSSVEKHIYFLASDELRGRNTGTHELEIAGQYIASSFLSSGIIPVPGFENYFQPVPFKQFYAPDEAVFTIGDSTYTLVQDLIAVSSVRGTFEGEPVFLEYGTENELEGLDLDGRVVIVKAGAEGQSMPQQWLATARQKNQLLQKAGAAAVAELYSSNQIPWNALVGFLNSDQISLNENANGETEIPHIWLNNSGRNLHNHLSEMNTGTASLKIEGKASREFTSNNVIGYIEGIDPNFKDEHILLSAHFDHIGISRNVTEGDSIYNGARDNAIGTAAIIETAKYFGDHPPKRSVIFAGWTAEEKGLLGSGYFAENPMIPLEKIIYNLNIDGGGYNDTTKVTVIGLGRTEADDPLSSAANAFGLEAIPDPVPQQNLFDRSDNVHFARKGIPSPTYSTGLTAFDDEINHYYHQVTDNPDTINYSYITRYIQSYIHAAEAIANMDEAPFWLPGDKYEEAGKELYGME